MHVSQNYFSSSPALFSWEFIMTTDSPETTLKAIIVIAEIEVIF